jgi:2,4-dienoyl-CoA reductase-like NADH-dependent reductase (Old Yellow Enzyme family)
MAEIVAVVRHLLSDGRVDFLDLSLWDCFKRPEEEEHRDRLLIEHFTGLPRGDVPIGVAGKIRTAADARRVLELGADFPIIGRAAILHHDFPRLVASDPGFEPAALPVSREHLRTEGVSPAFLGYLSTWKGFVAD